MCSCITHSVSNLYHLMPGIVKPSPFLPSFLMFIILCFCMTLFCIYSFYDNRMQLRGKAVDEKQSKTWYTLLCSQASPSAALFSLSCLFVFHSDDKQGKEYFVFRDGSVFISSSTHFLCFIIFVFLLTPALSSLIRWKCLLHPLVTWVFIG